MFEHPAVRLLRGFKVLILILGLILSQARFGSVETAKGVQCPTATVQTIKVVTYERTPCGCLVKKVTERAPRQGEAGFLQCRCAEKKDAQQETARTGESRPKVVALTAEHAEVGQQTPMNRVSTRCEGGCVDFGMSSSLDEWRR